MKILIKLMYLNAGSKRGRVKPRSDVPKAMYLALDVPNITIFGKMSVLVTKL